MFFTYKNKQYDTSRSDGEHSTNRIQLTEDKGLQMALINAWFEDEKYVAELLEKNELDVIFQYALIMAKNQDIICGVTGERVTKVGTYPDWVISSAEEQAKEEVQDNIKDIIDNANDDKEALAKIKADYYPEELPDHKFNTTVPIERWDSNFKYHASFHKPVDLDKFRDDLVDKVKEDIKNSNSSMLTVGTFLVSSDDLAESIEIGYVEAGELEHPELGEGKSVDFILKLNTTDTTINQSLESYYIFKGAVDDLLSIINYPEFFSK